MKFYMPFSEWQMLSWFGEQCQDCDPECPCCVAWAQFIATDGKAVEVDININQPAEVWEFLKTLGAVVPRR